MAGYIGSKAVALSTTGADINGDAIVDGSLTVGGAFTSLGIDDNATSTAITIDGSQNVGVGTATPTAALDIIGGIRLNKNGGLTTAKVGNFGVSGFEGYIEPYDVSGFTKIVNTLAGGNVAIETGGSERLRVNASGNLLVGTASTIGAANFTVNSPAGNVRMNLANAGVERFGVFADPGLAALYTGGAIPMTFSTNGAERIRILAGGETIFGSATPVAAGFTNVVFNGSSFFGMAIKTTGPAGSAFMSFHNSANTQVGTIVQASASTTVYNTSSDYRLKENVTPIQGAGDIVKAMRPCTYTFTTDGVWSDGFIAHELQELHPLAVTGVKDAMKDEEYEVTPAVEATYDAEDIELTPAVDAVMGTRSIPDYQGVDYSKLTPILTAALQEALIEITALKARVTALEGGV
jgi:hypothetical protein